MNLPQVYMCSPSWTLLPPHIPLGWPSAPAPSIQYCASNLDWQLISYMILHMFQCHSPKSSYPHPLPQSPKDYSIHLCLFCCLVYRVIVTIFLNSIYMCVSILYWCFSFWLTSLCIVGSSFIPLIRTDSNIFFLMDGTGRKEGGGFRMGNTCIPVADSCWYKAKPIQYWKLKNKIK